MTMSTLQRTLRQTCWDRLFKSKEGGNPWVTAFKATELSMSNPWVTVRSEQLQKLLLLSEV
jgi:hypothetical protein